jgi:hypothetical protein
VSQKVIEEKKNVENPKKEIKEKIIESEKNVNSK